MKSIKFFILVFFFVNLAIQKAQTTNKNSEQLEKIQITLRDSVTHKPIKNHPLIWFYNYNLRRTDSTGHVVIFLDKDSTLDIVCHSPDGYYNKTIFVTAKQQKYFLDIVPFSADPSRSFANRGKIIDTVFYKSGKIEKIYYQLKTHQNIITYYESGAIRSELINGDTREWYENGKVKHYRIYVTTQSRWEAEYDEKGKLKGKGMLSKAADSASTKTVWMKDKDWTTYP